MKHLSLVILILAILSCEKEVLVKPPPEVKTVSFQFIGDHIYLEGNVLSNGGFRVQEYGFEISDNNPAPGSTRVVVQADGLSDGVGYFHQIITNTFSANTSYTVKAYLRVNNEDY